ncbi:hypothetical protein DEI99_008590 [Curtobacterium sp. MCLR17_036]|uniref:hypothetical protein n=1 Tax=Curtobacterium sp. MCLR17_036 TaxID=2175620 RepID=UPI000DA72BDA|nr:hypothetical protein [Curtobacterium sp. MCLR17_036]WIE63332.1 hypothetical protein DEI99_008590 [Curtobacterium sp. MCLR17_036]
MPRVRDLAGTAIIPYPDVFRGEPQQVGQWAEMERELLTHIDDAAVHGPDLISGRANWRWVLWPRNADQQRYDDTRGSAGFDGRVPALTAWLEDAGALTSMPAADAAALLTDSIVHARVGGDEPPLEEQFMRVHPEAMLAVYPQLATADRVSANPWMPFTAPTT